VNIEPAVFYKLIWGIGIMSAVLAAAISAIFQLVHGWRERLAADKRHLRELALKAAIVQWDYEVARVKAHNAALSRVTMDDRLPDLTEVQFDMLLVRKLKLIETFGKANLTKADIERGLREMGVIAGAIRQGLYRKPADNRPDDRSN
jgi:hypothetical protein